ncbi:MAG TPA: zinc ribbon domain-containing protein [Gemmatimonadales bacterium]|jgi:hypothetical protein|nr:zinc ribbon domain-containing protein [Gemmatimonadales bacterium]
MDELTRFAQRLVERLAARPEGAQRPVSVAEVREKVLPYRAQRRALGLESVEDYETVLLRLVAEERGLVKTVPVAAAERARTELAQPNPDLSLLADIADATIQVTSLAAGKIVEDSQPAPSAPSTATPAQPAKESVAELCPHCETPIPTGRAVTFCPWCGVRLIPLICTRCGTVLEPEWRHCITCGLPVQDPFRTS